MLQPVRRRTWAPKGQTPLHSCWNRHDRLSVLCGITLSPRRTRFGVYFETRTYNINTDTVVDFIRQLRRTLGRRLILVLDRWSVHLCAAREFQERFKHTVQIEFLPAHAPDLNPVEGLWAHSKHCDLANFLPQDLFHLDARVTLSLLNKHKRHSLIRSFFHHAQLTL
jgi:transposase